MGNSIVDMLSGKDKSKLIIPNINKGDIFKMRLTPEEGIAPKGVGDVDRDKYFIVLGKTEADSLVGFVVINTNVNSKISPELQRLHYPISASKYPFLKKNRFVCCAELKQITFENFASRYEGDGRFGILLEDDLNFVIGALKVSPLITPRQLKKFGL